MIVLFFLFCSSYQIQIQTSDPQRYKGRPREAQKRTSGLSRFRYIIKLEIPVMDTDTTTRTTDTSKQKRTRRQKDKRKTKTKQTKEEDHETGRRREASRTRKQTGQQQACRIKCQLGVDNNIQMH